MYKYWAQTVNEHIQHDDSQDDMEFTSNESDSIVNRFQRLLELETKFGRATRQVHLLNQKLTALLIRYQRADREGNIAYRTTISLRVTTVKGVLGAFVMYTVKIVEEMMAVRRSLYGGRDIFGMRFEDYLQALPANIVVQSE